MQKRRIKRQYAQAARDAKRAGTAIKKTATVTQKVSAALIKVVKSNPKVLAIIGALFLIIIMAIVHKPPNSPNFLFRSRKMGIWGSKATAIV